VDVVGVRFAEERVDVEADHAASQQGRRIFFPDAAVAEKADAQTLRAEQKLQRFLALDIPDVADKADVKVLGRRGAIAPDVRVGRQWQPADARETERLAVTDVLDLRLENPSALVFQ